MADEFNLLEDINLINRLIDQFKLKGETTAEMATALSQLVRAKCGAIHMLQSTEITSAARSSLMMASGQLAKIMAAEQAESQSGDGKERGDVVDLSGMFKDLMQGDPDDGTGAEDDNKEPA